MILFYIECVFMKILFRNHRETFFSLLSGSKIRSLFRGTKIRLGFHENTAELLYAKSAASGMLHCLYARLCVSFTFVCSRD